MQALLGVRFDTINCELILHSRTLVRQLAKKDLACSCRCGRDTTDKRRQHDASVTRTRGRGREEAAAIETPKSGALPPRPAGCIQLATPRQAWHNRMFEIADARVSDSSQPKDTDLLGPDANRLRRDSGVPSKGAATAVFASQSRPHSPYCS
ncbi:hypothetical protein MTO96_002687 [Rhipicephalus appendiculatus]